MGVIRFTDYDPDKDVAGSGKGAQIRHRVGRGQAGGRRGSTEGPRRQEAGAPLGSRQCGDRGGHVGGGPSHQRRTPLRQPLLGDQVAARLRRNLLQQARPIEALRQAGQQPQAPRKPHDALPVGQRPVQGLVRLPQRAQPGQPRRRRVIRGFSHGWAIRCCSTTRGQAASMVASAWSRSLYTSCHAGQRRTKPTTARKPAAPVIG